MSPATVAEPARPFGTRPLALPAAWQALAGAGAALLCEGDPAEADFERLGVPLPESLGQAGPKRRREFLAGRLAAAAALRALGFEGAQPLAIGPDRLPQWPAGLQGSISHSGDAALCWVQPAGVSGGVGVDVEALMAPQRCERLWRRIAPEISPGQGAAAGHGDELLLTLAFSAKESLFKALYPSVRRYVGFDAAQVSLLAPDGGSLLLTLQSDWSGEWCAGRQLTAHCAFDPAGARVMTLLQAPSVK
ncbi:MAG TPA: 4'-phosphopantetheinyl transferase superfamily protein [Ideonella sp.]|nr:4'-phosphopantetheinyl transferase superfamily protein [Ideonella sp.]